MQDVAAIVVDIAVIDPRSKLLVTDAQLAQLNGADGSQPLLVDYAAGMTPGQLLAQWRAAIDANASPNGIALPQPAVSGIRGLRTLFLSVAPYAEYPMKSLLFYDAQCACESPRRPFHHVAHPRWIGFSEDMSIKRAESAGIRRRIRRLFYSPHCG